MIYHFLSGSYTWISRREDSDKVLLQSQLDNSGFRLIGFFPALGAVSGNADTVGMNLVVQDVTVPAASNATDRIDRKALQEANIEIKTSC